MILKKVVSISCPTAHHLVHSAHDSDLEDEHLRKMLASLPYVREREEKEGQARAYLSEREILMVQSSRNPEVSGKPAARCVQKRGANAQRIQACHSRRESLMARSSRELEVSGKLMRCFRATVSPVRTRFPKETEVANRFERSVHSVFKFEDPANVGNLFLMETRIICLIKQDLNL